MKHTGACHCGAVKFEFDSEVSITVFHCNCSICKMDDFQHLIIPKGDFRLLTPQSNMSLYRFNQKVAQHYFCRICGIKPWYIPRSNPDGVSVNFRCVDQGSFDAVQFDNFDGENWEANASVLSHLSDPL